MGFNYNTENSPNVGSSQLPNNKTTPMQAKAAEIIPTIFARTTQQKTTLDWELQFPSLSKMELDEKIKEIEVLRGKFDGTKYDGSSLKKLVETGKYAQKDIDNIALANRALSDTTSDKQDGKIGSFKQGQIGDCWLLSGLKVIASSEEGAEIIKKSITNNKNGTYTVKFIGAPNKKYVITEKEINDNEQFSTGDKDVKIIELATNKWRQATDNRSISAGGFDEVKKLLTGEESSLSIIDENATVIIDNQKLKFDSKETFNNIPDGRTFFVSFYPTNSKNTTIDSKTGLQAFKTQTGTTIVLEHACYAEKQGESLILHNPHDTGKEPLVISVEEFLKHDPKNAHMHIEF